MLIYLGVQSFLKYFKIRESNSFCFYFFELFILNYFHLVKVSSLQRERPIETALNCPMTFLPYSNIILLHDIIFGEYICIIIWSMWIKFQRRQWKKGGIAPLHRLWMICIGFLHIVTILFYFSCCQGGKGDSLSHSRFI